MLVDRFERVFSYLRISVTDRCNFRCVYCMPEEGVQLSEHADLLSFEEITRVARVGAGLGLTKIRLTGGEPTVRRDLPVLVRMLRSILEVREIAMTTNASRLSELAEPLKAAGLDRLNISLDTLNPTKSQEIARRDYFEKVHAGIRLAHELGFPLKFNTVVMRGVNDAELLDLTDYAQSYGAQIRFIEYMPMGIARFDEHNKLLPAAAMKQLLSERFRLLPEESADPSDPARGFRCADTGARVAFITSMSDHFCATCSRMRLTALGGLRPCLHQEAEVDLRGLLRSGASDAALRDAYAEAAGLKWAGHHLNDVIPLYSAKEMVAIGG